MYAKGSMIWPFANTGQKRSVSSGFTIVELLIVIVVIGILASITVVTYSGAQKRARNAARVSELVSWKDQFELYFSLNGQYPSMADGGYCLGTGFPDTSGDGVGDCHDLYWAPGRASENTTLNDALRTVGDLPSGIRDDVDGSIGPYTQYSSTEVEVTGVFEGSASECPANTTYIWDDGNGKLFCGFFLQKP